MKKLFFLGALFAVGLGFSACSSDKDEVAVSGSEDNGGGRYLAISINLPNVPPSVTRTDDNGGNVTLNDGMANEYEVKDATLIIFNAGGTFVEAHSIDTKPWTPSSDDHVTRVSTKVVQKVGGGVAVGNKMLVILNNNNLVEVQTGGGLKVMTNGSLADFSGKTFDDLTTAAQKHFATTTGLDCGTMNANGFYMANAPLADKQGSTATAITGAAVQVLVPISAVYETETAAAAGTADQIYVERGMAKVTMESAITTPTLSNSKIDGSTALVGTVTGWTIDNTNPQSYLVRSTNNHSSFLGLISNSTTTTAKVYRYIGNTVITQGSPSTYKYRTYFAESANYNKSTALNRVIAPVYFTQAEIDAASSGDPAYGKTIYDIKTPGTTFSTAFGDTNPQYCFENTFSVDDQDVNKTTLVQVAIQAIAGSAQDLYTVNGNKSSIYTLSSLTTLLQSKAYDYVVNNGKVKTGTLNSTDFTPTLTVNPSTNAITAISLAYSGTATLLGSVLGGIDGTNDATNGTLVAAAGTYVLDQTGAILKYVNGVSYYHIRIKHFGDLLTPWNENETPKPSTDASVGIYPATNQDGNYLGRYGVLRNNWYNLKVNSIKSLGEATPHTGTWPDTPDDELDNYITFQINILSWAKHVTQNADL